MNLACLTCLTGTIRLSHLVDIEGRFFDFDDGEAV